MIGLSIQACPGVQWCPDVTPVIRPKFVARRQPLHPHTDTKATQLVFGGGSEKERQNVVCRIEEEEEGKEDEEYRTI